MTPHEFKQARKALGLTQLELSRILDVCPTAIRKWEAPEGSRTSRKPNPTACQVMRWMLAGMRPDDYGN